MLRKSSRSGATLVEMLVALTLAGIVLGAAMSTLLRQQRTASSLGVAAGADAQSRAALGALSAELAALTSGFGDLDPAQVSDTAVQLRSVVTSGLSCEAGVGRATFAREDDGTTGPLPGAGVRAGDSLWWFVGAPPEWRVRRVIASDSVSAFCQLTGGPIGPAQRVIVAEPDSIPFGAPLRVTRPHRYAFYRSGDGSWQLGVRDWVEATARFASPQPIAGPFLMRAGDARTGFRFYDAGGAELDGLGSGAANARITRVRITVLSAGRLPRAGADTVAPRDSLDVALQSVAAP